MDDLEKWLRDFVKDVENGYAYLEPGEAEIMKKVANLLASNRAEIKTLKEMIAEMKK